MLTTSERWTTVVITLSLPCDTSLSILLARSFICFSLWASLRLVARVDEDVRVQKPHVLAS
ncbi:MAG: hypothetical protein QXT33_06690 [Thermofilum sp.]